MNFLYRFSKNIQISNFMKIHVLGAYFFDAEGRTDKRTDGQTDMTKLIVVFHNFANAPKSEKKYLFIRLMKTILTPNDIEEPTN